MSEWIGSSRKLNKYINISQCGMEYPYTKTLFVACLNI